MTQPSIATPVHHDAEQEGRTVLGRRHHADCRCGCWRVVGLRGTIVQDDDTPKLLTLAEPLCYVAFDVPSPAGGALRAEQVAYSLAELGLTAEQVVS